MTHSGHGNATATAAPRAGFASPTSVRVTHTATTRLRFTTAATTSGCCRHRAGLPRTAMARRPSAVNVRGSGIRLGAYLLDGLLYGLLMAVFAVPGAVLLATSFEDCVTIDDEIFCPDGSPNAGRLAGGIALIAVGFLLVAFIYVRALGKTGQPWGARIVGVKVIGEQTGEPIGFGRALGRALFAGFISAQIFYLGYLWMLWDDKKQTWQDKVVGSIVVKV